MLESPLAHTEKHIYNKNNYKTYTQFYTHAKEKPTENSAGRRDFVLHSIHWTLQLPFAVRRRCWITGIGTDVADAISASTELTDERL